jgi:hypothetical protein
MTPAEVIQLNYKRLSKVHDRLVDMYYHRGLGALAAMLNVGLIDVETYRAAGSALCALSQRRIAKQKA